MTFLVTNPDNETDGGTLELDGASSVISADVGGFTYVFVAGGLDDGISVFRLNQNGTLTPTYDVTDDGSLELGGARGLSTVVVDGNTYLFAAGSSDNGVSAFRVNTDGSLTAVANVDDGGAPSYLLTLASDTATAKVGGTAYLFVAGTTENGISTFRVAGNGQLTDVGTLADDGTSKLAGVSALSTVTVGGNTFLIAGGNDDGITVFQVSAAGTLTHTSSITDNATLRLKGIGDVATAVVGGVTYVFAAGTVDNGVSVFSVNSSGILANVDNKGDTAALRLGGASGLGTVVIGQTTYLVVGGNESGASMFRVNTGGTLTAVENIDDAGSLELSGSASIGAASVGGTNYLLAAGATDDGVSVLGSAVTGQLWFTGEGGDADSRITYVNDDGGNQTVRIDNSPATDPLPSSFVADVGLDTAAGFYFSLTNSGVFGDNAVLVRGLIDSAATPTIVVDFPDSVIANGIYVDNINHQIYVGYQDGSGSAPANTGIRVYSYSPTTGAVADQGFLVTSATDSRGQEGGFDLLDPRDFAVDSTIGRMFYTELLTGGAAAIGLFRFDFASPNTTTQLVSQAQFPDDGSNGYIYDVEVDPSTDLVYFTTQSQAPSPDGGFNASQNAIWYISENASSGTATKVTLVGAVGATFYPGDMVLDGAKRQIYVESEEGGSGSTDDVIYVFQLDAAGTSATLINTIYPNPTFISSGANLQGMVFNEIPLLSAVTGTASQVTEQAGAGTVLLTGAPTITDFDGDHLASATVQITGGKFSSNEDTTADDHLAIGAALQTSGLISGTNITVSWNAASETLTLSGYDTFANYQAALADVRFYSSGDNPTNYGLNPTRTVTWTVSDGSPDIPGGSQNSATTTFTIAAVNDAPVSSPGATLVTTEDLTAVVVSGVSVSDPDANPALTDITVTLTVEHGTITIATNVADGITAGDITGGANGSATITLTATANEINATLAGSGLTYTPTGNFNGADTLQITTNDGGNTGTPGTPLTDIETKAITIAAVNDAPVVIGDGTESATTINEDVVGAGQTLNALFAGQYSDAADNQIAVGGASSPGAFSGIAVTANGSTAGTGQWQYFNGAIWVNIGPASDAAAVLLSNDASTLIRFNPALNFNGPAPTLTAHLVDNSLGFGIVNGTTVNISGVGATGGTTAYSTGTVVLSQDVTAVNDAPVNTVPGTQSIDEDATITFTGGTAISVDDPDVGAGNLTVTLSMTNGQLTLSGTAGLAFGNGDGLDDTSMTFTGTQAAINAALAGLLYETTQNFNGTDTLTIITDDNGNAGVDPGATGDADSEADTDTVTINIAAINDTPVVTVASPLAVDEQVAEAIAPSGTISDIDLDARNSGNGDYAGATLSIANNGGNDANDLFAIGTSGLFTISGSNLQAGSLTFATFSGGNGTPLAIAFTSSGTAATTALVNAVVQSIRYTYTGDTPPASIQFDVTFDDGAPTNAGQGIVSGHPAATTASITVNITDTPENEAPVVDLNGGDAGNDFASAYTEEGTAAVIADTDVTITDADVGDQVAGATITITDAVAGDQLTVVGALPGSIVAAGGGTATVTLSGTGTQAEYQQALTQIRYSSTSNDPTVGDTDLTRSVTVTVTDGISPSAAATTTVTLTGSNDAPASTDATITAIEDTPRLLAPANFGFADPDSGDALSAVIITGVTGGTLYFDADGSGGAGLPVAVGSFPQTYTAAQLTAGEVFYLAGPNVNGNGIGSISFQVIDDSGAPNDTDTTPNTLTIDVTPINDTPVVPNSPEVTTDEQVAVTLNPAITISDIDLDARNGGLGDYGGATFVANRTVSNPDDVFSFATGGALFTVSGSDLQAGGLTFATVSMSSGILNINFTSSGTTATSALVNDVLRHIQYTNTSDAPPASVTILYVLDDGAPDGVQGALGAPFNNIDGGQITVNITPINEAPVIDLNGGDSGSDTALTFTEDDPLTAIAPLATAGDIDSLDFDTGTLTVAFAAPVDTNDLLRVVPGGDFTVEEDALLYGAGSIQVGSVSGGSGGSEALVITFNAAATPAIVQELVRAIGFVNFSGAPVAGDRTLVFTLTDGDGGTSTPVNAVVTVVAVEDAATAQDDLINALEDFSIDGSVFTDNGNGDDLDPDGPPFQVTEIDGNAANVGQTIPIGSGAATIRLNADGTFTFTPNGQYNHLPFLATATESFTYTITGGDTATVTLTIAGDNDAATITTVGVQDTAVTEAGGIANGTAGDPNAGGQLGVTDPDVGEGAFQAPLDLDGTYGSFTFDDATGIWTYTLDDARAATQALQGGAVVHDTLDVTSTDNTTYTIDVSVTGGNDAPTASVAALGAVNEQIALDLKGKLSVADVDAGTITATLSVGYGVLTVTAGGSGAGVANSGTATVTLTGTLAQINALLGSDATSTVAFTANTDTPPASTTLTLGLNDGALTGSANQSITINPVNDAPSGTDTRVLATAAAPHVFSAADFGFSDLDGNALLAVFITTAPTGGKLYIDIDGPGGSLGTEVLAGTAVSVTTINAGQLVLAPDVGAPNTTFTFQVQDDGGTANGGVDTDPTPNTIRTNNLPVAVDDTLAANEDQPVIYTAAQIVGNDTDADLDPLVISGVSNPANGTAVLNGNGTVTFTSGPNFSGVAGFDYTVSDGKGGTDVGHVTVNVAPVNDAPVALATRSVTTDEDTPSASLQIGAFDVEGDPISYGILPGSAPAKGSVNFVGGNFVYTPFANANGSDSFVIRISDSQSAATEQSVSVTINPVNDAPVAVDDSRTAIADTMAAYAVSSLLANDSEVDGDTLQILSVGGASHGTVKLTGSLVQFTPEAGFTGTAGFDYTITDGNGGQDKGHVTVLVGEDNDDPSVDPDQSLTTLRDTAIALTVLASDPDGDPLSYAAGAAAHGTVTGGANGAFTYTPDEGFLGSDSFTVTVSDGKGGTASQSVAVSVADLPATSGWSLYTNDGFVGEIGGTGTVFGTNGFEDITVVETPGTVVFDGSFNRGDDVIRLSGDAADWRVVQSGANAVFSDGDSFVIVPVGSAGTDIVFDDGARTLGVNDDATAILIGGQEVTDALVPVTAAAEAAPLPDDADAAARGSLYLSLGGEVTAGGSFDIFGTNGTEEVTLLRGEVSFDGTFNRGGDTLRLLADANAFEAVRANSQVLLEGAGYDLAIPVGSDGMTLAFADGDRTLIYDEALDSIMIGIQPIGPTSVPLSDFA